MTPAQHGTNREDHTGSPTMTFGPPAVNGKDVANPTADAMYPKGVPDYADAAAKYGALVVTVGEPVEGRTKRRVTQVDAKKYSDHPAWGHGGAMTRIHHINCGTLLVPPYPTVPCHCLLLEDDRGLALVDTGIGLLDVRNPVERLGRPLIDAAGFQFSEPDTAVRRVEALGFRAGDVRHVVLTHGDPDHAGGLADFPDAVVHVSVEEHGLVASGRGRYALPQFAHGPAWKRYPPSARRWFGLEARPVEVGFGAEVLLVPLFGHTLGHCGVAVQQGRRWVLHVGDAYYLRVELEADDHPVSLLAAARADDDALRRASLEQLRRLARDHGDEINLFGYHDGSEFPGQQPFETPRRG